MISQDNEEATKKLLKIFPEFKSSVFYGQTDESIPYLVFGDFSNYLKELLQNNTFNSSEQLIQRVGKFITDLYLSENKDLKDLVRVGIFEDLSNDPCTKILADFLPSEIATDFKSFFQPKQVNYEGS